MSFNNKIKLHIITKELTQKKFQASPLISTNRTNNSNYFPNKTRINNHLIINSKIIDNEKRIPNLMKNIHHRPKIAISCDNFRYQPLSSLEKKLSKQLGRISNKYTEIQNRKFFNKDENTETYWQNFPDYEIYRQLKELEVRKEIPYGFPKPRLKPLINNKKDKLGILAKNLYEADQIERFKKLLYKYKISKEKTKQ